MFVVDAVMFLGNYHNVRGDYRNVPWNYLDVLGFCRFVPGNSPGLGIGYRDCFAFPCTVQGLRRNFRAKKMSFSPFLAFGRPLRAGGVLLRGRARHRGRPQNGRPCHGRPTSPPTSVVQVALEIEILRSVIARSRALHRAPLAGRPDFFGAGGCLPI